MTVTLITGANKGLGFEAARQLVAAGHQVWIGARDPDRGKQAADAVNAQFVQLDVTDDASVAAAAHSVGDLDVLVNNAGIAGERTEPAQTTAAHLRRVYETNVFGPVRVLHAFLPILQKSARPVVVNVSSGLGSISTAAEPGSAHVRDWWPRHDVAAVGSGSKKLWHPHLGPVEYTHVVLQVADQPDQTLVSYAPAQPG